MLQVSPSSSLHDWYSTPSVVRMNISSRPSRVGAIDGSSHGNMPPKPSWCQIYILPALWVHVSPSSSEYITNPMSISGAWAWPSTATLLPPALP